MLCYLRDGISDHSQQITVLSALRLHWSSPHSLLLFDLLAFCVCTAYFPTPHGRASSTTAIFRKPSLWAGAGIWETPALLLSAAALSRHSPSFTQQLLKPAYQAQCSRSDDFSISLCFWQERKFLLTHIDKDQKGTQKTRNGSCEWKGLCRPITLSVVYTEHEEGTEIRLTVKSSSRVVPVVVSVVYSKVGWFMKGTAIWGPGRYNSPSEPYSLKEHHRDTSCLYIMTFWGFPSSVYLYKNSHSMPWLLCLYISSL